MAKAGQKVLKRSCQWRKRTTVGARKINKGFKPCWRWAQNSWESE